VHDFTNSPVFLAMFRKLHLHIVDIMVFDPTVNHAGFDEAEERKDTWEVVRDSENHAHLCTSFNAFAFSQPGFDDTAIRQINQDFDQGAIAVKIWKNIGESIVDAKGNYLMPDNPIFEPIYRDIAAHGKTLIAHLADPDQAWEPLDPAKPAYSYYSRHPEWYLYNRPNVPSKEQILRARDHILEENPNLRVVGAHLGSMENDFDQLGQRLDRYPNFAVDMAARMTYLMLLPRDKAIAFVTRYQDRLIYGTDFEEFATTDAADIEKSRAAWENAYARDWRALATSVTIEFQGHKVQGLDLSRPILRKLYHDNAVKWFPGVM
jgi:predicted TIM-barrel fold metal-dependent hydrolase